jgi:protocatechuate 3,4-dioxygenase beta subunit
MRRYSGWALTACTAIAVSGCAHPAARARAAATASTATIRGRVYDRATGRPLAGAVVRARLSEEEQPRATTDASGRYELHGLRPATYDLRVSEDDYLEMWYGQDQPTDTGEHFPARAGFDYSHVDFGLWRGGIVSGRIVDERGIPVANTLVTVRRFRYRPETRELFSGGSGPQVSDAAGVYRVVDLEPSEYVVSAALRGTRPEQPATDPRQGYALTFFPGTTRLTEARRFTIAAGARIEGVNITLIPATLATISGTVIGSNGERVTTGSVSIGDRARATPSRVMPIGSDGTFVLPRVPPGEYILHAFADAEQTRARAMTSITVAGSDVIGVQLVFVRPSTASGRIVSAAPLTEALLRGFNIAARMTDPQSGSAGVGGAVITPDLTFTMKVASGGNRLRLERSPAGWSLKAVRLNGADITDTTLNVRPNENVEGLEIEVTDRTTVVSGAVSGRGRGKHRAVVIFNRDESRWGGWSRYVAAQSAGTDRRFAISGLPAGEYYAAAIDTPEIGRSTDPDFLRRLRAFAVPLSLGDGETRILNLTVAPGF